MCVLSFSLVCFTFSMLIGIDCGLEQRYRVGSLKTVLNYKLQGHQIKTVKGTTLVSCGQSCLEDLRCASTNFGVLQDKKPVCELNDIGISLLSKRELHRAEGFVFTLYSEVLPYKPADMEEGCKQVACLNQGQCHFNQNKQTFHCRCALPWTGERCETKIVHNNCFVGLVYVDVRYQFTSLGAKGRFGPKTNSRYQGTSLESITVHNGLQTWRVPVTGQYQLEVCGASGGGRPSYGTKGGVGARVQGDIHLEQGTMLTVLVGQKATGGGGGGGTFVVFATDNSPLAIAGGGGAADIVDGYPGQAIEPGSVNPGMRGNGGKVCVSGGHVDTVAGVGGGGGLLSDGRCYEERSCSKRCSENDGGKAFAAGGEGGFNKRSRCAGGFGGGGNCGGGGGYSGGGVQVDGRSKNLDLHAGGGGSFIPQSDWIITSGDCPAGNGFVTIEIIALDY